MIVPCYQIENFKLHQNPEILKNQPFLFIIYHSLRLFSPKNIDSFFFSVRLFFQTLAIQRAAREERGPSLFISTISTRSRTFRHLFVNLHVRWLSCNFNRTACNYRTAARWDLLPSWITVWLTDDGMLMLRPAYLMIWF